MKREPIPASMATLDQTIRHLQHLKKDLDVALELQWERPPGRTDPQDPGIRSRGGHSDPTGDTSVDEARLRLRRQVAQIEKDVVRLEAFAWDSATALGAVLRAYKGE